MNKQLTKEDARRLWVSALRSGEYKKGKFALCRDDKYCCLGVACNVFEVEKSSELGNNGETFFSGESEWLPKELQKLLGISPNGIFKEPINVEDELFFTLSDLNDHSKLTLPEIANVIEKNFKNNNFKSKKL